MRKEKGDFWDKNKRIIYIILTVFILLLIPLVAMQFSDEVFWDETDFIVAGILLLSAGFGCELVMRNVANVKYRVAIIILILLVLLLTWAELAVGLFGTRFAGS